MSDTPITNAACVGLVHIVTNEHVQYVPAALARKLESQRNDLLAALQQIIDGIPACNEGELVVLHYDGEGNELGFERIDPLSLIQSIEETARAAIAAAKEGAK